MADGQATPAGRPDLRASAPHRGGPLGSSGAAPDDPPPHIPTARVAPDEQIDTDRPADGTRPASGTASESESAGGKDVASQTAATTVTRESDGEASGAAGTETGTETGKLDAPAADATAKPDVSAAGATAKLDAANESGAAEGTDKNGVAAGTTGEAGPADKAAGDEKAELDKTAVAPAADGEPADGEQADGEQAGAEQAGAEPTDGPAQGRKRRLAWLLVPLRLIGRGGRVVGAWARRPSGRLVLPAMVVLLLLGAAGTAGAFLVPAALNTAAKPTPSPSASAVPSGDTGVLAPITALPTDQSTGLVPTTAAGGLPTVNPTTTTQPVTGTGTGQRPADVLASWAQQVGTKVGIPVVAVQAYGYAELVLAKTTPGCHLSWTTIAAIAKIESNHGSYNGSVLGADGIVRPTIYGLPLDGQGGRQLIRDTDRGVLDGDSTYDRAVGPLQFIPSTWESDKVDADNDGTANPSDIFDASLTAANYLCKNGRDLSNAEQWWDAILSYNTVQTYAQNVFNAANDYGQRSRS